MRKLILAAVIGAFAFTTHAQTTTPPAGSTTTMSQSKPMKSDMSMSNGVCMHDGKMMTVKDGKMAPMTKSMKMKNGTMVMADGSYTTKDGKKMMLKDGQMMDQSGNVTTSDMPMKSNGNMPPKQ